MDSLVSHVISRDSLYFFFFYQWWMHATLIAPHIPFDENCWLSWMQQSNQIIHYPIKSTCDVHVESLVRVIVVSYWRWLWFSFSFSTAGNLMPLRNPLPLLHSSLVASCHFSFSFHYLFYFSFSFQFSYIFSISTSIYFSLSYLIFTFPISFHPISAFIYFLFSVLISTFFSSDFRMYFFPVPISIAYLISHFVYFCYLS